MDEKCGNKGHRGMQKGGEESFSHYFYVKIVLGHNWTKLRIEIPGIWVVRKILKILTGHSGERWCERYTFRIPLAKGRRKEGERCGSEWELTEDEQETKLFLGMVNCAAFILEAKLKQSLSFACSPKSD